MAQKTVVTVVCDLPHDGEVEGTETVSFAFDGTAYEIDVCAAHAKDLREKFGKYVEHARRVAGGGGGRRRRSRSGPGRERSSEIRAWAKQRGHKVSERGRIPAAIIAEYESSHKVDRGGPQPDCGRVPYLLPRQYRMRALAPFSLPRHPCP